MSDGCGGSRGPGEPLYSLGGVRPTLEGMDPVVADLAIAERDAAAPAGAGRQLWFPYLLGGAYVVLGALAYLIGEPGIGLILLILGILGLLGGVGMGHALNHLFQVFPEGSSLPTVGQDVTGTGPMLPCRRCGALNPPKAGNCLRCYAILRASGAPPASI